MELSWLMKLRISAVIITGAVLIGIFAWPLASPHDPLGAVRFGGLGKSGAVILLLLAFWVGFIAYFISWPYGREIGVLAVPSGLAIWAIRSGSMANLMQFNPTLPQRQTLFATLRGEPFFWLLIIVAGFAGVFFGQKIWLRFRKKETSIKFNPKPKECINAVIAVFGTAVIAYLCTKILAQDFRTSDNAIVAQPAIGQIIFAVLVSFGIAAYIITKLFMTSLIWLIISSALVTVFAINTYANGVRLQTFVQNWPATFFPSSVISILPIQMVVFGALGSIAGYWLAVRSNHNEQHETK